MQRHAFFHIIFKKFPPVSIIARLNRFLSTRVGDEGGGSLNLDAGRGQKKMKLFTIISRSINVLLYWVNADFTTREQRARDDRRPLGLRLSSWKPSFWTSIIDGEAASPPSLGRHLGNRNGSWIEVKDRALDREPNHFIGMIPMSGLI